MPQRANAPIGAPIWIDLLSSDIDGARSFYDELFGWTSEDTGEELGHYVNFNKDGRRIAGGMGRQPGMHGPDAWTIYLRTDDAAAATELVSKHGGTVFVPPMAIADLGTMAVLADPGGAVIGLWQPATHDGFELIGEPGAPGWFELHTPGHATAVAFYRDALGWDTHAVSDTPEFRYTTLGEGDDQEAGIMDAAAFWPTGVPAQWSIYFQVEDTDKTLTRIVDLGGNVVEPAQDTPHGRLATATDPTGARFKLMAR
jgi:predicted enzyme related to lactoylglutathione lyase